MARVFQDTRQRQQLGKKAPWFVEWRNGGKRHSRKIGGKMAAEEFARQIESQLLREEFGLPSKKTWSEFRQEYESKVIPGMRSERSRYEACSVLRTFEQVAAPQLVRNLDRRLLDEYVAIRREMPGKKRGSRLSPETIRKELRTIRAALSCAHDWGYLPVVPSLPRVEGFGSLKRYMTWEHFKQCWAGCQEARMPEDFSSPCDWWRALLKVFWITGVRVGALLTSRWEDVDLQQGTMLLRAKDTKQKKDHILQIAQVADELKAIRQLRDGRVFAWNHHRRTLDEEWDRIQIASGIHLRCPQAEEHECTRSCHLYGFHDIRRSHATYNYGHVDNRNLQRQMGHASFSTTQRYIAFAEKVAGQSYDAFLPEALANDDAVKSTCKQEAV